MRRVLFLFSMLMLTAVLAFSQGRVITGRVTDKNGKPIPYASVLIKGSKTGVQADVNGEFTIKVNPGDVLQISQAAFESSELAVGASTVVSAVLNPKASTIPEVIVTSAFQTRRTLRSQSSNIQNVSAEQLNTVRQANINNALAGKVAGIQVRSQSAMALGRETNIRLRGENGLGVGSGPIYVVDGTIVTSAGDINIDDIEDITVLQGPASAALFGPDGANGAIVVTTKRAKKSTPGVGIEVNSGFTWDVIGITPQYQNSYAGGTNPEMYQFSWDSTRHPAEWKALDGKYYHNYDDDASWGPRMNGQEYIPWYAWYGGHADAYKTASLVPQKNNIRDFYNTGFTKTNNISFSKATDNANLRISYTNLDVKGLIPNQYLKKNTLNSNFSMNLNSRFVVGMSLNYVNQRRNADNDDGYANQSSGNFNQWFHRDLDMNKMRELKYLRSPQGILGTWNFAGNPDAYDPEDPLGSFYGANYWFNQYSFFDLIKNFDERSRLFGDVSLTYKVNNDLSIKGTYRRQQLNTSGYNIYPSELQFSTVQAGFNPYAETTAESLLAAYQTSQSFSNRQYFEALASYSKKLKDFQINSNAGVIVFKSASRTFAANTSGGLSIPGVYSLANSVNRIRNLGSNVFESIVNYQSRGLFIKADVGYKNFLFLEGSFRKDYASAEPFGNSINTKSLGASFVFTDLIQNKSFLSYGKVRVSTGQILNTLNPYDLDVYYTVADNYNGNPTMSEPNALVDPKLRGAANTEREIGAELRFFKNRYGLNFTYYSRKNTDFPVAITTSGTTGYTSIRTNAGEIAKNGVELQAFGRILDLKAIQWDVSGTWSYILKNRVVSIAADGSIKRLVSATGAYGPGTTNPLSAWVVSEVGQEWGQLHGTGIKRINGKPVLNADGTYVAEADVNYGSVLPRYTGGTQNTFTIKNDIVLSVNIDYSSGGKFFSLSNYWGDFSGLTARTATLNDKGNSIRDDVEDGGGVHVVGVDENGDDYDVYMAAKDYYGQFYSSKISEKSVYDLTFVKMRELSLGYKLPIARYSKYVKSAVLSFYGRNLWLLYSKTRDFDPSEISGVSGEDGQMPGARSYGFNLKLNF